MERKVILFIATSLDGYIATNEGSIDFLSMVEQPGEDYGYSEFNSTVDTVIIGRKTYDKVLSMGFEYPHADKEVYIITRTERPTIGNFKFYTGDLTQLVNDLKSQSGNNIYCDGGAEIAHDLMRNNLIDEFIISIIPVMLGNGIRLFNDGRPIRELTLVSTKQFASGLVQLHYK